MAARAISVTPDGNTVTVVWTGLTFSTTDWGEPFRTLDWADFSIQIDGTFGAGGSVTMQGSNSAAPSNTHTTTVDWHALTDPQGNAVTKTARSLEQCEECPKWIRPIVTAGDGTTSMTVIVHARRNR